MWSSFKRVSAAFSRSVWSCCWAIGLCGARLGAQGGEHSSCHPLGVPLEWPDRCATGSVRQGQGQLQGLRAGFSCLHLPVLRHSAPVPIDLGDDNLPLPSVASYACMAVISAVEQMILVWQITSLGNARPYDPILGIFVCSENQKIFNYKKTFSKNDLSSFISQSSCF